MPVTPREKLFSWSGAMRYGPTAPPCVHRWELPYKVAMELADAREEELCQPAARQEEKPVPDENRQHCTRLTTHSTRKASAATSKLSDSKSDFRGLQPAHNHAM